MTQTAYMRAANVPTRTSLQAAVHELGFDLRLDPAFELQGSSGFQPCVLAGQESGVEVYISDAQAQLVAFPQIEGAVGDRRFAVTFRWGGDMNECACALIVSAALARSYDAVVHYEDDDLLQSAEELDKAAHDALAMGISARPLSPIPPAATPAKPWWKCW